MSCCQCEGIEQEFDLKTAQKEQKRYRKKGPAKVTRLLIDAFKEVGVEDKTLIDVGGGIGGVQYGLIEAGLQKAYSVDASTAYVDMAKDEADRLGYADQIVHQFGNFANMNGATPKAELLSMDKVICCYDEVEDLISSATQHSTEYIGVVYPRTTWWTKVAKPILDVLFKLRRSPFKGFLHDTDFVESQFHNGGFERTYQKELFFWQVCMFRKV